jgi:hypothetical protein
MNNVKNDFLFPRSDLALSSKIGKLSRQQTLWAMIDWSYDLLDDQEQVLFKRLSVFAGGWDLEAAESICSEQGIYADTLGQLVDQSLVVFGYDPENKRYRINETIRQFARQQLHASGEEPVVLEKHAGYYEQVVRKAIKKQWRFLGSIPYDSCRMTMIICGQPWPGRWTITTQENQVARAIQLFAAAQSWRFLIGSPLDADVQEHYAQALVNLRARLGDLHYDIEWSKGAAMTLEQVLDLALSQGLHANSFIIIEI